MGCLLCLMSPCCEVALARGLSIGYQTLKSVFISLFLYDDEGHVVQMVWCEFVYITRVTVMFTVCMCVCLVSLRE